MKRTRLLDSPVILVLASALIWPLFVREYMDNWASIESTFISDGRMLSNNLPHPGWQPLWYCGTRFDYVYPPALRYGTALISKFGGVSTARAYHLYTALLYVFGIAAVYWLVLAGSGSRGGALLATAATALLSPSFFLLPRFRLDSGYWVPQRLHVLTSYGEGPHISALCILPAALAATFLALRHRRPASLAIAAALCAFLVANNFYGATALAIFFPIVVWSVGVCERTWRVWAQAGAIVALACGLSAFWLTPSFFKITVLNLKWVSQPGNTWSMITTALIVAAYCAVSLRLAMRKPGLEWRVFVTGAAAFLCLDVIGFYYFGFRVSGESLRLVPELDLALILLFVEGVRAIPKIKRWQIPAAIATVLLFAPAFKYLRHVWSPFPRSQPVATRYEYQTTKWVHDHLPGARVLATGSVRFWLDAWFDNAEPDGGSMQGMLNQIIPVATWQILQGEQPRAATLWLQALGTDAVVVPDKTAPDAYHDYKLPEKFRGAMQALYDDGHGTVIYRTPRVHPGIGRLVNASLLSAVGPINGGDDITTLQRYIDIVEEPRQPAVDVHWSGFDAMSASASIEAGQTLLLQETFDPAWHAYEEDRPLRIYREPVMGFMLVDVSAGMHTIRMRFETPLENRAGQVLFVMSLIAMTVLFALSARRFKIRTETPDTGAPLAPHV